MGYKNRERYAPFFYAPTKITFVLGLYVCFMFNQTHRDMRQVSELKFKTMYPRLYMSVKHLKQGGVIIVQNVRLYKERCDSLAHRNIHIRIVS